MNMELPTYKVQELSMDEAMCLLDAKGQRSANDSGLNELLDFEELALLLLKA